MKSSLAFAPMSWRFVAVWRRNLLVWRKLAVPSLLGNFADPMIYMLGLGYGLGALVSDVGGVSYITFLAAGTVCFSTMNSASFEGLYSAFSRMHVQRTWDAILNAPVTLEDVALAELVWAATKASLSGMAIMVVAWGLGLCASLMSLWVLPLIPLIGLAFAALALCVTALARSYDFFMYYFTLVITPMAMLCGVFFPPSQLPTTLQAISTVLPLTHATALVRPLMLGLAPENPVIHVGVLALYAFLGFHVAVVLFRRRFLD